MRWLLMCLMVLASGLAADSPKVSDFGFMGGQWHCEVWGGRNASGLTHPVPRWNPERGTLQGLSRKWGEGRRIPVPGLGHRDRRQPPLAQRPEPGGMVI